MLLPLDTINPMRYNSFRTKPERRVSKMLPKEEREEWKNRAVELTAVYEGVKERLEEAKTLLEEHKAPFTYEDLEKLIDTAKRLRLKMKELWKLL